MKRSGRTLKQRLYDLKHLPLHMRRMRYFRGHGVHSPYVYNLVRQVFMRSTLIDGDHNLHDTLLEHNVLGKRAIQLQNLVTHCGYKSWSIDNLECVDMVIATLNTTYEHLCEYATYARENRATLCIMNPYNNANRLKVCKEIIAEHPSTTVDNRGYLLLFNNHLPKQRFSL